MNESKEKVTVADIARRVGMSKSAVAKVLHDNRSTIRVWKEKAELIRKVADEMHYRPNTVARALRSGRTGLLGIVLGGLQSPYFAEFAEQAMEIAEARGRRLIVSPVRWGVEREQAALDSLLRNNVDGVILKTGLFSVRPELAESYFDCGTPIVLSLETHPLYSAQGEDVASGMRELFHAMRRSGIADLAMAVNDRSDARREAYLACCSEFGVAPRLFRFRSYDQPSLKVCADEIVEAGVKHLLVCSDHYALRLLSLLGAAGLRIPEDIAIASIGGTTASSYANPPLTVIDQNIRLQAEVLLDLLLERIEGSPEIRHRLVPTRLVARKSFPLHN